MLLRNFYQVCQVDIYPEEEHKYLVDLLVVPNSTLQPDHLHELDPLNLDYEVSVKLRRNEDRMSLHLDIKMERKFVRSFIEIIAPPGILVIVSWVNDLLRPTQTFCLFPIYAKHNLNFQTSFLIPISAIPGRLGTLLTLFLCAINIFNSLSRSSPKSGGSVTAIMEWVLACLAFIIMAILEYILILAYKKFKGNNTIDTQSFAWMESKNVKKDMALSKCLDIMMIMIFPPVFLLFSCIFWYCKLPNT